MIEDLGGIIRELAELMSELSEQAYTADWMDGLEYALRHADQHGPRKYGRLDICDEHISALKNMSESIGGWIYFDDKSEESFINILDWQIRPRFNS